MARRGPVTVSSSNIAAVDYDPAMQEMFVVFLNGATYKYSDVPQDEYESLISAASVGSFFNDNIKGHYPYAKV